TDREIVEHLQEARRHLVKAKLLELVGNGRCRITERGRRVLADYPLGVDDSVLVQFPEFRRYIRKPRAAKDVEVPRAREYTLGYESYRAGRGLDDNPYRFDNADHQAWENGWFDARDDDAQSGRSCRRRPAPRRSPVRGRRATPGRPRRRIGRPSGGSPR